MDENTTETKTLLSKLQFILTLIAIIAPIFYLIGLSYYHGIMITYGISTDIFEMTVQDIYVAAYLAIFQLLVFLKDFAHEYLLTWSAVISLVFIFIAVVVIFQLIFHKSKVTQLRVIKYLMNNSKTIITFFSCNKPGFGSAITFGGLFTLFIANLGLLVATIFSIWALPYTLGYLPGKYTAEKNIEAFFNKGCYYEQNKMWSNCKILQSKDGKTLYEGILIANSETRIAFFTKAGAVITQIPDGSIIINKATNL